MYPDDAGTRYFWLIASACSKHVRADVYFLQSKLSIPS